MLKLHPQAQQLLNLLLLLTVAKYVAHIYLTVWQIAGILFFTWGIEYILLYIKDKDVHFSFSSLSTALGVILMMVSTHYYLYFILLFFALFQKHFLQYHKQHFFNPSNFALIMGLLLFYDDTHIVLGQLGDSLWLALFVCVMAIAILYRVNRWIIPIAFSLFYIVFQYIMVASTDPMILLEDIYYRFYSISFIVFILFMLTDPRTTPANEKQQIGFGFFLAFISSYLDYAYGFRVQHMFMALFLLSPFVVVLQNYTDANDKKRLLLIGGAVVFLALGAIIYIESQPPYYFEMDI